MLAEDSSFFRNYVRQVLVEAGFHVETAADGAEAFATLENAPNGHFSLILSDIEMPVMDGLELAKRVRSSAKFARMPLVAITTRFSNSDIDAGRQAGFTEYLEKLNAEKLIDSLDQVISQDIETKEYKRASNG